MKKKTNIKTLIRQIAREEVAMAINEVITELKQPTQQVSQPRTKKKIIEKKQYTKNSILNDVLNETVLDDEWKQMGGETYDSGKMNEVLGSSYSSLMNPSSAPTPDVNNTDAMVASLGENPNNVSDTVKDNIFKKDYRSLVKAMDKKANQSRGA